MCCAHISCPCADDFPLSFPRDFSYDLVAPVVALVRRYGRPPMIGLTDPDRRADIGGCLLCRCWFDLVIVSVSVFDTLYVVFGGGGTGLSVLRLMRIFRIVRIFNKLDNMKKILNANFAAFGPVFNAFLLFAVVLSIFSVIAVNIFVDKADFSQGNFVSFTTSFITLLGITTGEEWSSFVRGGPNGDVDVTAAVYFLSFIILVSIMAFNIIQAVLLEGFVSSMTHADTSKRIIEEAREHHKVAGPLDPLLATLVRACF